MKTNAYGQELSVCTTCLIKHYENCTSCFGWGIIKEKNFPALAFDVMEYVPVLDTVVVVEKIETMRCPECNSNHRGAENIEE